MTYRNLSQMNRKYWNNKFYQKAIRDPGFINAITEFLEKAECTKCGHIIGDKKH